LLLVSRKSILTWFLFDFSVFVVVFVSWSE